MRRFMFLGLVAGFAPGLIACSGGDDDGYSDDGLTYDCASEDRDDEFVIGLSKDGESSQIAFTLMSSDPAPPSRGDNTWMLQLTTMASPAAPVTGAKVTVTPFMPDHDHPSGKAVVVTPDTAPGTYKLEPVNLGMPGLWETTIQMRDMGTNVPVDKVVFRFCLPS